MKPREQRKLRNTPQKKQVSILGAGGNRTREEKKQKENHCWRKVGSNEKIGKMQLEVAVAFGWRKAKCPREGRAIEN